MKKAIIWVLILAFAGMAVTLAAMGLEIFGRMDPDVLLAEAYVCGACMVLFFAGLLYWRFRRK